MADEGSRSGQTDHEPGWNQTASSDVVLAGAANQPAAVTTTANPGMPAPTEFAVPMPMGPQSNLGIGVSLHQGGAATDALIAKMTPEHIGSVITQADKDSSRRFIERIVGQAIGAAIIALCLVVIFALSFLYLSFNKPELATPIITLIVGLIAGGIGGYGYGTRSAPKPTEGESK